MSIRSKSISVSFDNKKILEDINLELEEGEILSIIGPNGAGKSTFLNILSGDIKPDNGSVLYDEKILDSIGIEERSFTRSVMSQSQVLVFDFLVKEIIEMGWIDRGISSYAKYFKTAMTDIIRECDIEPLLNQTFNTPVSYTHLRAHET